MPRLIREGRNTVMKFFPVILQTGILWDKQKTDAESLNGITPCFAVSIQMVWIGILTFYRKKEVP
jgi:hypothetical protein